MKHPQLSILLVSSVVVAGVVGWAIGSSASLAVQPTSDSDTPDETAASASAWLTGTTQEKFTQIERHLRGLDQSMAEIGYRYGELLFAAKTRNWEYAQYQTEKIDLSLRLAIERRPQRAKSAQPFLNESLPAVMAAVEARDGQQLASALDQLYQGCVQCHQAENVLHFREAVDRIRDRSQ